MINLYGTPVSNYFNTLLAILHFKQIEFKHILQSGSQDKDFLSKSPMGKIPFIEDDGIWLSETTVIIDYLETRFPAQPLYPVETLDRARTQQLIKFVELYIDAPSRRLFPGVFWFQKNHEIHIDEVLPIVERGLNAVDALVVGQPYLLGEKITCADFYTYFSLQVVAQVMLEQYGLDIFYGRETLKGALQQLERLPYMPGILNQRKESMESYLENKKKIVPSRN